MLSMNVTFGQLQKQRFALLCKEQVAYTSTGVTTPQSVTFNKIHIDSEIILFFPLHIDSSYQNIQKLSGISFWHTIYHSNGLGNMVEMN